MDCNKPTVTNGLRCHICNLKSRTIKIPNDFLAFMQTHTQEQAVEHYGVSIALIQRWCKKVGHKYVAPLKQAPDWFITEAATMTRAQVKVRAGIGDHVLDRWCTEHSVRCIVPAAKAFGRSSWKPCRSNALIVSKAEAAAEYLKRYGPINRCDEETGSPNAKGTHWRRRYAVLSDAEVIERAYYNGWKPDAWRQLDVAA